MEILKSRKCKRYLLKGKASNLLINKLESQFIKLNSREVPALAPSIRRELIDYYQSDVLCLEKLISKKLSSWLI